MTYTEIIKALGKDMDLIDLIERQQAEIDNLTHTLLGVMHSVDKRLDGDGKEGEKKDEKTIHKRADERQNRGKHPQKH